MNVDDLYGEETLRVVDAYLEGRATDEQSAEIERLTTERDNYESILRMVCEIYKHDTTGYFIPGAAKSPAQETKAT